MKRPQWNVSPGLTAKVLATTRPELTQKQVAEKAGCSVNTVRLVWKTAGLSRTHPCREVNEERVVELTRHGKSAAEIAAVLGCSDRHVVRVRAKLGVAQRVPGRIGDEVFAPVPDMLADGWPLAEIARTLGVSADAVIRRYRGQGWTKSQVAEHLSAVRVFGKKVAL